MKMTMIGLMIFSIGLALQVLRLDNRIDRLERRAIVTSTIPTGEFEKFIRGGCITMTPN